MRAHNFSYTKTNSHHIHAHTHRSLPTMGPSLTTRRIGQSARVRHGAGRSGRRARRRRSAGTHAVCPSARWHSSLSGRSRHLHARARTHTHTAQHSSLSGRSRHTLSLTHTRSRTRAHTQVKARLVEHPEGEAMKESVMVRVVSSVNREWTVC